MSTATDAPALRRRGAATATLSHAQQRMWFADAAAPGNATYTEPLYVTWNEPVDVTALTVALTALVRRHEILRTTYRPGGDGIPVQVIEPPAAEVKPETTDLTGVPDAARLAREDAELRAREPFDLATGPVLRCHVWRGLPGGDAMLLAVHHIATDGGSYPVLFEELAAAYDAALAGDPPPDTPPPLQYADFAAWERATTAAPETAARTAARAAELAQIPGGLALAGRTGAPAAPDGTRPGGQQIRTIPAEQRELLTTVARSLRVTPYVLLLAAYQAVLHRWSGREGFLLGTIAGYRPAPELERLPGLFVNTVPLRCDVRPEWSFAELCTRGRSEAYRSLVHRALPYDLVAAALPDTQGRGRGGPLDAALVFQDSLTSSGDAGRRWNAPVLLGTGTAKFDLLLHLDDTPDGITATLEYDTDRYPGEVAAAIARGFADLLAAALAAPQRTIAELPGGPPSGFAPPVDATGPDGRSAPAPADGRARTPAEQDAADLFSAAFAVGAAGVPTDSADRLGPDSDFFALGGHSLMAVTMLAQARRRHGASIAPRDFLLEPTVAGLARLLDAARSEREPEPEAAPDEPADGHPATVVQQRFWFLDRVPSQRPAYLMPTVVAYTGPVDPAALHAAVTAVLGRHPALRSRFTLDRKRRLLVYRTDGCPPEVASTDAAHLSPAELEEHVAAACRTGFDLEAEAPVRAEVVAAGEDTLLVLVAHHIAVDGWSRGLLLEQIALAYRVAVGEDVPALPDPVHPARAAGAVPEGAAERAEEMAAWLRGAPTDVPLPYDRKRGEAQTTEAVRRSVSLGAGLTTGVREAAAGLGCTAFMTAAALLGVVLARRSGQRDFLFAFPWAGREAPESADAVAMLINTLVLRVDLTGGLTWRELLARVKESSTYCYRRADVRFDSLVAALHPDRDLSRPPLTPVYLTFWDGPPEAPDLGPGTGARLTAPPGPLHIKYEVELDITEHAEDIEFAASALYSLFDTATVTALLDEMVEAAAELANDPGSHPL